MAFSREATGHAGLDVAISDRLHDVRESVVGGASAAAVGMKLSMLRELADQAEPQARATDVAAMLDVLSPVLGEVSCDVAAGTSTLCREVARRTGAPVFAISADPLHVAQIAEVCRGLEVYPILGTPAERATLLQVGAHHRNLDSVVSMMAMHSLDPVGNADRQWAAFHNIGEALKVGGRYTGAEVPAGSTAADWFDDIVAVHSLAAHRFRWLSTERIAGDLSDGTALTMTHEQVQPLIWTFASVDRMAMWFRAHFALDLEGAEAIDAIGDYLGFSRVGERIRVEVPLQFFTMVKLG